MSSRQADEIITLPESHELWLRRALEGWPDQEVNTESLLIELWEDLPEDFYPSQIDKQFYYSSGRQNERDSITLLGMYMVEPDSEIFDTIDSVVNHIKARVTASPSIRGFDSKDIAETLEIPVDMVQSILGQLNIVGSFWSRGTGGDRLWAVDSIEVRSASSIAEYLRYSGIRDLLQKVLQRHVSRQIDFDDPGLSRGVVEDESEWKNRVFVLMPIDRANPDLEDVLEAIKEVSESFGLEAVRADEIEHQQRITDIVLEYIRRCEFLIADLSGERPNVYYEVGYAHALQKRPILYRKRGTTLHFDLSVHNVPEYSNITDLKRQLSSRFEAILGRKAV